MNENIRKCELTDPDLVRRVTSFFKVLGDETRVRILYALYGREMCVTDISDMLEVSGSAVSHQLKQLKLEGHVKSRREGKNIFYSLDDEHVVDIIHQALTHVTHKLNEK